VKLAASITRSLQANMGSELGDIERAVATGTRDAGRGLKTELRRQATSAGLGQRLANSWRDKALPEPEARRREPGLYQGASDRPSVRRGCGHSEQARALPRDPDRERSQEGHRWQADHPAHFPGAPLRAAPIRASAERSIAPCGRRIARLVQQANGRAQRLPARH